MTALFRTSRTVLGALMIGMAAANGGCSAPAGTGDATTSPSTAPAATSAAGSPAGATADSGKTLTGAGATFPAPLYQKWFQEYAQKGGVQINYQPIGSGGGIKAISSHTVDFGASDAPLSDDELKTAPGLLHIPTVAGPVVVLYNLPGLTKPLNLDGATIAGMFDGKITTWNDPKIAALNPGVTLPATPLVSVHRADGSGTTNAFTTYLNTVSPDWKAIGAGKSVKWPGGVGAKGSPGVTALVQQTPGAVGYAELNFAQQNKVPFAAVRNAKGKFITPSVDSTVAAAAGISLPPDFRKVIVNTPAPDGYPIASFTYLLVYPNAKPELKPFLKWALTDGQKDASGLSYAPLPANVQKQALAQVEKLP